MNRNLLRQAGADTPCYLFDFDRFRERTEEVKAAFGGKVGCCYSVKANPFLLAALPSGLSHLEVCSPGELAICEALDVDMTRVIFSGVNKTAPDILRAIHDGVGCFTAESPLHVRLLEDAAGQFGCSSLPVLLRLSNGSQFGMDEQALAEILRQPARFPHLAFEGLHYFTGTRKKKAAIIERELRYLETFCDGLKEETGFSVRKIEYGAGLDACVFPREGEDPDACERELLRSVSPAVRALGEKYELTVEMGRFFAAPCGTYLTRVTDVKTNCGYDYAICDGGIHQLHYDGQAQGLPSPRVSVLRETGPAAPARNVTVAGSLCTTGDILATAQPGPLSIGDLLVFHRAGAYSVTEGMANFLSRDLPAVFAVMGDCITCLRERIHTAPFNTPKGNLSWPIQP